MTNDAGGIFETSSSGREHDLRRQLQAIEQYLARVTEHVARIQAERDRLIMQLADNEGLHDRHSVAVR